MHYEEEQEPTTQEVEKELTAISSPKNCCPYQIASAFHGEYVIDMKSAKSIQKCEEYCLDNEKCISFSYAVYRQK